MLCIRRLDRSHTLLQQALAGSVIALEGEPHVIGRDGLAVVEDRAFAQDEIIGEAVLGRRERLCEARRLKLTRHRLHQAVVQRIEDHEGRDDPGGFRRVEPRRGEGNVHAIGQLPLRRGNRRGPRASGVTPRAVSASSDRRVNGAGYRVVWRSRGADELIVSSLIYLTRRRIASSVEELCAPVSFYCACKWALPFRGLWPKNHRYSMTDGTFDAMHRGAAEPAGSRSSSPHLAQTVEQRRPKQRGACRHNIDRHSGEQIG